MRTALAIAALGTVFGLARAGSDGKPSFTYIDLQPKANQKLDDGFHGAEGNDLSELPRGE